MSLFVFFFKQKTAYEVRISDWSSDVCSSDLLDPFDPEVIAAARREGIPDSWLEGAKASPVYKLAIDWKLALPLHPEYRTLPMVWYVPPLSPIQSAAERGRVGMNGELPDVASLRIPVRYLANKLGRVSLRERACQYV